MSSRRLFAAACAGLLTLVVCHQASGGDTEAEFWPELNAFVRLDDTTRLFFLASWTRSAEHPEVDGQLGAHLDVTLEPFLHRHRREADWARERYLFARVGSSGERWGPVPTSRSSTGACWRRRRGCRSRRRSGWSTVAVWRGATSMGTSRRASSIGSVSSARSRSGV